MDIDKKYKIMKIVMDIVVVLMSVFLVYPFLRVFFSTFISVISTILVIFVGIGFVEVILNKQQFYEKHK